MLAPRVDLRKRGGNVTTGGPGGKTATTAAWPLSREPGVNIKQKISQWEGLSQQEDVRSGKVQTQRTLASRRLSGDLLGNGLDCNEGGRNKVTVSKSLGLDFRENHMTLRPVTGEIQSDFPRNHTHSDEFVTSTPATKSLSTVTQVQVTKLNVKSNNFKSNHFPDVEISSLPQCADDPEALLPPGNFYTSRGFWKRLEADESFWEREKDSSMVTKCLGEIGPSSPPPKPQRTFQYKGASSPPGQWIHLENQTPTVGKSDQVRKHDIILKPPSCPPPPCPVNTFNGFSRNRKNRWIFFQQCGSHYTVNPKHKKGNGVYLCAAPNNWKYFKLNFLFMNISCQMLHLIYLGNHLEKHYNI